MHTWARQPVPKSLGWCLKTLRLGFLGYRRLLSPHPQKRKVLQPGGKTVSEGNVSEAALSERLPWFTRAVLTCCVTLKASPCLPLPSQALLSALLLAWQSQLESGLIQSPGANQVKLSGSPPGGNYGLSRRLCSHCAVNWD